MLWIGGVQMPEPKADGLTVTKNKIWSKNAGRAADGNMVGDIVGIKYKLDIQWAYCKPADVQKIDAAVSGAAFFPVRFVDPGTGQEVTRNFYAGDPKYPVHTYAMGGGRYKGVSVSLIEQ